MSPVSADDCPGEQGLERRVHPELRLQTGENGGMTVVRTHASERDHVILVEAVVVRDPVDFGRASRATDAEANYARRDRRPAAAGYGRRLEPEGAEALRRVGWAQAPQP
ncbi:hypothetical protein GCM10010440_59540 [Kitasatospora cinereorecta]